MWGRGEAVAYVGKGGSCCLSMWGMGKLLSFYVGKGEAVAFLCGEGGEAVAVLCGEGGKGAVAVLYMGKGGSCCLSIGRGWIGEVVAFLILLVEGGGRKAIVFPILGVGGGWGSCCHS